MLCRSLHTLNTRTVEASCMLEKRILCQEVWESLLAGCLCDSCKAWWPGVCTLSGWLVRNVAIVCVSYTWWSCPMRVSLAGPVGLTGLLDRLAWPVGWARHCHCTYHLVDCVMVDGAYPNCKRCGRSVLPNKQAFIDRWSSSRLAKCRLFVTPHSKDTNSWDSSIFWMQLHNLWHDLRGLYIQAPQLWQGIAGHLWWRTRTSSEQTPTWWAWDILFMALRQNDHYAVSCLSLRQVIWPWHCPSACTSCLDQDKVWTDCIAKEHAWTNSNTEFELDPSR